MSDVDNFNGVPNNWLPDIARIAILAGRIEFVAYHIARALDLAQPKNGRSQQFSRQCEDIRKRLDDPWRPVWISADGWGERARAWAEQAPSAMDEHRNRLLHRSYLYQMTETGLVPAILTRLDDFGSATPVSHDELLEALEVLKPLSKTGLLLWQEALTNSRLVLGARLSGLGPNAVSQ